MFVATEGFPQRDFSREILLLVVPQNPVWEMDPPFFS